MCDPEQERGSLLMVGLAEAASVHETAVVWGQLRLQRQDSIFVSSMEATRDEH